VESIIRSKNAVINYLGSDHCYTMTEMRDFYILGYLLSRRSRLSHGLDFRIYLDHNDIANFHGVYGSSRDAAPASRGTYYVTVFFFKNNELGRVRRA